MVGGLLGADVVDIDRWHILVWRWILASVDFIVKWG